MASAICDGRPRLQLPHIFCAGGKQFILSECPASRYDEMAKLLADAIGKDEFPTPKSLMKRITSSQMVVIVEEKNAKELAGVTVIYPSPLSRSEKPIYHAAYQILTRNFRKTGLASAANRWTSIVITGPLGYRGFLGRTHATSKALVGLAKTEHLLMGVIPRSISMANIGMVDDLIVHARFDAKKKSLTLANSSFASLRRTTITPFDDITFTAVKVILSHDTFLLRPGTAADEVAVECLLRDAATNGEGFAIDEFNEHGQFNRAFLQHCHMAVLCDSEGSLIGAALFGLSGLVRTTTWDTSHLYVIVTEEYRNRGIGQKLLESMLTVIRSVGYSRILTDVYYCNHKALHICHKLNFMVTGSIPDCGYLKDKGYTSSYVLVDSANYSLLDLEMLSKL